MAFSEGAVFNSGNFNGNKGLSYTCIAVDHQKNIYAAGSFVGSFLVIHLDTLVNSDPLQYCFFMVKYDSSGHLQWTRGAAISHGSQATALTTDDKDNVCVTGSFVSAIQLSGLSLTIPMGSSVFTARYNAAGSILWAKAPRPQYMMAMSNAITADTAGNVSLTGYFQADSITFDQSVVYNPSPYGATATFTVQYDPNGNVNWTAGPWGGNNNINAGKGIVADASGNLYVTGYYQDTYITFDEDTLANSGLVSGDMFLIKYNKYGDVIWGRTLDANSTAEFRGNAIAADDSVNVVVLVSSVEAKYVVSATSDTLLLNTAYESTSFIVISYAADGRRRWIHRGAHSQQPFTSFIPYAIAVDHSSAVYISGKAATGIYSLGGISLYTTSPVAVLAKLDTPADVIEGITSATKENLSIFPNPTTGLVTITHTIPYVVSISDVTGRQIATSPETYTPSISLDLSTLPAGLYIIFVSDRSGVQTSKRITIIK